MKTLILFIVLLVGQFTQAQASIDVYKFNNTEQETRFHALIKELRCPKCQNSSISDSNAELAKDLRERTYTMIIEGKSDQDILNYMMERYGDFVTYNPPLKPMTWILWFAPFIIGAGALAWLFIRKQTTKLITESEVLTNDEKQRLARLLADKSDKHS